MNTKTTVPDHADLVPAKMEGPSPSTDNNAQAIRSTTRSGLVSLTVATDPITTIVDVIVRVAKWLQMFMVITLSHLASIAWDPSSLEIGNVFPRSARLTNIFGKPFNKWVAVKITAVWGEAVGNRQYPTLLECVASIQRIAVHSKDDQLLHKVRRAPSSHAAVVL